MSLSTQVSPADGKVLLESGSTRVKRSVPLSESVQRLGAVTE